MKDVEHCEKLDLARNKIIQRAHETIRSTSIQDCIICYGWSKEEATTLIDEVFDSHKDDLRMFDEWKEDNELVV